MEITEAGNLKWYAQNGSYTKTIEYKKNDGEWTQITSSNAGTMISVAVGDILSTQIYDSPLAVKLQLFDEIHLVNEVVDESRGKATERALEDYDENSAKGTNSHKERRLTAEKYHESINKSKPRANVNTAGCRTAYDGDKR